MTSKDIKNNIKKWAAAIIYAYDSNSGDVSKEHLLLINTDDSSKIQKIIDKHRDYFFEDYGEDDLNEDWYSYDKEDIKFPLKTLNDNIGFDIIDILDYEDIDEVFENVNVQFYDESMATAKTLKGIPLSTLKALKSAEKKIIKQKSDDEFDFSISDLDDNEGDVMDKQPTNAKKSTKETLKNSAKSMVDAASDGLKLAAVQVANEAAYEKCKKYFVKLGIPQDLVDDEKFKEILLMLLPLTLHPIASMLEGQTPYASKAKAYCELAITNGIQKNSAEFMKFAMEMLSAMAGVGTEMVTEMVHEKIDYKGMRVPALKKLAKQKKLRIASNAKKDDIIEALEEMELEHQQTVNNVLSMTM